MSRKGKWRVPRPEWFAHLRSGDVLRSPSGTLRVVRDVTRGGDYWDWKRDHKTGRKPGLSCGVGALRCAEFVKLIRSQYQGPLTIYFATELVHWRYVGARVRLTAPLDIALQWEMDSALRPGTILHQCEAVGVMP